ncbi:unnamed protein product [Dicrocoelium dendriticum]|nr:unnamed protein product [Dicrocoelium dendriticum]
MASSSFGQRRSLLTAQGIAPQNNLSSISDPPTVEGKRIVAAKIAGSVGTGAAPTKVINAFMQVKDYTGLDRYLCKHQIPTDILNSALQKACMTSDQEAVEIICMHGANANFVDQFGTTLLHFAMRGGGDEGVIKALISHGLEYTDWRSEGMPLLHWACSNGMTRLVEFMVEQANESLQEPDASGRLPIHVAAVSGQPEVLSYLIRALSKRLRSVSVPTEFRKPLEDILSETEHSGSHTQCQHKFRERRMSSKSCDEIQASENLDIETVQTAQTVAASNYLDVHQWTPLHHASCEEATNCYQDCLKILLDNGADPMLPTLQGKTALDLAYAAGRSQVLVDVLPKRQLIALLVRVDDIVPLHARRRQRRTRLPLQQLSTESVYFPEPVAEKLCAPVDIELNLKSSTLLEDRTRKGYSFVQQFPENMEFGRDDRHCNRSWVTGKSKTDGTNVIGIWRKILLNDNVELLEALRDSMVWREQKISTSVTEPDFNVIMNIGLVRSDVGLTDFDSAQKLSLEQMSELFADCYENGTGVFSYVQANYQHLLRVNDFLSVLRAMTGLLTFNSLATNKVVILRPLYRSLLFLAVICGRFRVAEQLLRMRQFDVLPAAVLVALILRRLRKEPSFPQQVISELERFTDRVERIAVDVLNLVSLKDNTPEKMICREMLSVRLTSFGDLSLIDLFAKAKCNELLSLPCCQRLLDERWLGVLIHLPTCLRWSSRIIPLTGLTYLEYKSWKQRTKTCSTSDGRIARRSTGGHSAPYSIDSVPNSAASVISTVYPRVPNRYYTSAKLMGCKLNSNKAPQVQDERFRTAVYDKIVGRVGWQNSPRLYFVVGVYRSPSTKFCLHSIFHLLFLFWFSIVCVYSLHSYFTTPEIMALSYVAGYAVEEIRQIIFEGLRDGLQEYAKDGWNWIDLMAIGLTCIGFCIRIGCDKKFSSKYQEAHDPLLYSTRNLYMLGLNLFYMRTLYITSISQTIGPRLKMMADMLRKDLVPLLIVFAIFICSYGVWFQGLIHPNSFYETYYQRRLIQSGSVDLREGQRMGLSKSFKELFKRAFYSIFEVSIVLEEESCDGNEYCGSEEGMNIVIYFVLVLYTGIVNIILINLLIALFSNTVSRIDQKATALWLAERYKMVKEYSERTILPPPFNILCVIYEVCMFTEYMCRRFIRRGYRSKPRVYPSSQDNDDPVKTQTSSEASEEDDTKITSCETKSVRARLRNARFLQEVTGKRSVVYHANKWELDAVLKFILLQSFALQNRRQTLGGGKVTASTSPTDDSDQINNHDLNVMCTQMNNRMLQMEQKLDTLLVMMNAVSKNKSVRPNIMHSRRSPTQIRMPNVVLNRAPSSLTPTPVHIPSSKELFAALAEENDLCSEVNFEVKGHEQG